MSSSYSFGPTEPFVDIAVALAGFRHEWPGRFWLPEYQFMFLTTEPFCSYGEM